MLVTNACIHVITGRMPSVRERLWVGGRHPSGPACLKVTVMEPKKETGVGAIKRFPSPRIAGRGKTIGTLIEPLVREQEWECLG